MMLVQQPSIDKQGLILYLNSGNEVIFHPEDWDTVHVTLSPSEITVYSRSGRAVGNFLADQIAGWKTS